MSGPTTSHTHATPLYQGYPARDMSAGRLHHGVAMELPEMARPMLQRLREAFAQPYAGIGDGGETQSGLYPLQRTGVSTEPVVSAARAYLARLRRVDFRRVACQPLDSPDRRWWTNAFPDWMPSGVFLADLESDERAAALDVIEASLSARGFADAQLIMRTNQVVGEFVNHSRDTLCEFGFFFTLFGEPTVDAPWGWRLMGNHLVLHCTFVGDQMCLTPAFLGTEMSLVDRGPDAGTQLFADEQRIGLELAGSLDAAQRARAVLHPSMKKSELPKHLTGPDGRHLGGAGQDNRAIPYEGVPANALSTGQRALLMKLIDVYAGRMPPVHRDLKLDEVRRHLDATRFAWIGDPERVPFYYRVHSPVILIEFDHHSGVFIANDEPEPFHIHTIVRTPNGNDYGMDWLAQHYAQFPHR